MRNQGEGAKDLSHTARMACAVGQVVKVHSFGQLHHLPDGEYAVVLEVGSSKTKVTVGKRTKVWLEFPVMVQRMI